MKKLMLAALALCAMQSYAMELKSSKPRKDIIKKAYHSLKNNEQISLDHAIKEDLQDYIGKKNKKLKAEELGVLFRYATVNVGVVSVSVVKMGISVILGNSYYDSFCDALAPTVFFGGLSTVMVLAIVLGIRTEAEKNHFILEDIKDGTISFQ